MVSGLAIGCTFGILSGVKDNAHFIAYFDSPSDGAMQFLVAILFGGAALGSALSGHLADAFGRWWCLIAGALLLSLGCALQVLPLICQLSMGLLVVSRAIIGVGVGIANCALITYIAETAPSSQRGSQEAMLQMSVTVGLAGAFAVSYMVLPGQMAGWKVCLASQLPLAKLFVVVAFMLPESPRWLVLNGEFERARSELGKLRTSSDQQSLEDEMQVLRDTCKSEQIEGWLGVVKMLTQRNSMIALAMMIWFPLTGIDVITQYAPEIFAESSSGLKLEAMELQDLKYTFWVGLTMALSSLPPIFTIDIYGRRPLLLIGTSCMIVCLACLAVIHAHSNPFSGIGHSVLHVGPILMFIFGFSLAASVFVALPAELLGSRARAKTIAISWAVMWSVDYLVTSSFLSLNRLFGLSAVFILYTILNIFFGAFLGFHAPETVGCELDAETAKLKPGGGLDEKA